jgi:arylsulfatase A-like enzyme
MIESVDDAMGKILNVLEENDLMENTIIIFTSDNGGHIVSTDNSPLKLGKGHSSEGGIRVPLSISFGNKIKAGINNTPICSIDMLPTITNLLGVKMPENITLDGVSFKDVLIGEKVSVEERNLYWHFPHYWWGQKVKPYSIVRSGNWKLIKNWENSDFELYDLDNDISEKHNLAELNQAIVKELNFALDNWLNEVGAKKPILKL